MSLPSSPVFLLFLHPAVNNMIEFNLFLCSPSGVFGLEPPSSFLASPPSRLHFSLRVLLVLQLFLVFTLHNFVRRIQARSSLTWIRSCTCSADITSSQLVLLPFALSDSSSDSDSWLNLITAAHPPPIPALPYPLPSATICPSPPLSRSPPYLTCMYMCVCVCVCLSWSLFPPCLPCFPPGSFAVLLPGGGRAGLQGRLVCRSGRGLAHVVRRGAGSLGLGHGEPASGRVCGPTAGLEGRAPEEDRSGRVSADSRGSGHAQGLRDHGWAKFCHQLHDRRQSDPTTAW